MSKRLHTLIFEATQVVDFRRQLAVVRQIVVIDARTIKEGLRAHKTAVDGNQTT